MPRTASRKSKGFIWLPRVGDEWIQKSVIKVNGDDVTVDVYNSEFTKAVCPEIARFKVELINSDEKYTDAYSQGQYVELYADFDDGTTPRFKARIDSIKNRFSNDEGFILTLEGGQYELTSGERVTKSYTGSKTSGEILVDITATFAPQFTVNDLSTDTSKPTINWDSKTFWDCVNDLTKLADADAYLDENDVIQFFDKNSIENNQEAIVWNDNLIDTEGLGEQTITTKNKVQVLGDDGSGLPVIYTSEDSTSQTDYGVKMQTIFDNKIDSTTSAQEVADAEISSKANPDKEGDAESFMLPSLQPGDKIWVTNPPMKINGQYRIYSLTHKLPNQELTTVRVNDERKNRQIIKKRFEKELASQTITNPYRMTKSINLKFDSETELASKDSNVQLTGGKISLSSGTQGRFTSVTHTFSSDITECHLRVVGSDISSTDFELSTDSGTTYEDLVLEGRKVLNNQGSSVVLRVTIQSATTEIDSIALLLK